MLRFENEIAQLREQLSELEHEIAAQQQRGLELKGEIDRHESRIQFNEERLREIESQNSKALGDITQAEERCRAAEEELTSRRRKQLSASEAALAQHKRDVCSKAARHCSRWRMNCVSGRKRCAQAQAAAFAAAQELTRVRNEITALDLQKQGNVDPPGKTFRRKNPTGRGTRADWSRVCRNLPRASRRKN